MFAFLCSMGVWADDIPTFDSLEDWMKSGLKSGYVNVTINDAINFSWDNNGDFLVSIQCGDTEILLQAPIPEQELNWLPGGTVSGTLTNVYFSYHTLYGETEDFWKALTYKAPEVTLYESIADLLADKDNLGYLKTVSVKINDQISEIRDYGLGAYDVYLDDNKIYIDGKSDPDRNWVVGGTLTGTLENVTYVIDEEGIPMLYIFKGDIFKGLTYTAPIPTFGSLDELAAANIPNGTHVNVYIEGTAESALTEYSEFTIFFTDKSKYFALETNVQYRPDWYEPGGMLTGTIQDVVYNKVGSRIYFSSPNKEHNIFEGLVFTPNFQSLQKLYEAIDGIEIGSWVPVRLNGNEIVNITGNTVCVKEGDNVFALKANVPCSSDWKVGGTLGYTWLAKYNGWDEELGAYSLQYAAKNSNPWSDLSYTFVETFNSLDELIESGLVEGPINITINNVLQYEWDNEGWWYVYVQSGNKQICLEAPLPDSKPDWMPGGTVYAELNNVWWNSYSRSLGTENKDFWNNFTYTPPVVTEYESIADLLAADIQGAAVVTVKNINNQISKIDKWGDYYDVYLDDNKIFLAGKYDPARNWEVGGTLTGKLENVIFATDEVEGTALYLPDGDILEGLTYTAPAVGTISVSSVGYATYFTDKEFVMPEGLEGYVVTPKDETSVTLTKAFEGGEIVPASTALLVKGEAGSYPCAGSNTGATFTGDNCLHGNLTAGTVAEVPGASKYYKLLNGSNGLGWYLGAPDGGVFTLGANKAYLALSEAQAQNAKALSLDFSDETTAINGIEDVNADSNVRYNLNGMKINSTYKGMYIKNGKKFINK